MIKKNVKSLVDSLRKLGVPIPTKQEKEKIVQEFKLKAKQKVRDFTPLSFEDFRQTVYTPLTGYECDSELEREKRALTSINQHHWNSDEQRCKYFYEHEYKRVLAPLEYKNYRKNLNLSDEEIFTEWLFQAWEAAIAKVLNK